MIAVEHVSRQFGTFRAVDDISFSIATGEIVGLLGPNGAGKTTTMRMIAGFLEPSGGTVAIDGMDVVQEPVAAKRKIGYMPESAPLYADMIVADYLDYVAAMEGVDPAERVPHLADVCGLREVMHKNIADLSRGNRQRVGLAHALMGDPEILILDEPTSGLDPNQVEGVRSLIKALGKTRTVIVSTHILSEVEALCGRVIIISKGKKVADAPTEELRARYGNAGVVQVEVAGATEQALADALRSLPGVASCAVAADAEPGRLRASVGVQGGADVRPDVARMVLTHNWDLFGLEMQRNSLEDVFRSLTTGGDGK